MYTLRAIDAIIVSQITEKERRTMIDQVAKLKQIAIDKYDEDGGTMCECSSEQDYRDLIAKHGTAKKAWKAELEILEMRRENGGYYE